MKNVTITDFLTNDEIERAKRLYIENPPHKLCGVLVENLIKPRIERINKTLGQENDPRFLAYAVEYVFMKSGLRRSRAEV